MDREIRLKLIEHIETVVSFLESLDIETRISAINLLRTEIHFSSPFCQEPVDLVLWVKNETVRANDYNPNSVAPPEMKLLAHSIIADGYTQPIVSWKDAEGREVVDGFHRNRVGRESPEVRERVRGYLPVVTINQHRSDLTDRMASTIRHNRARGKHQVDAMADIVVELKRRNWSDDRICRELGMEQDEVLRLCQITGLAELFQDSEFSKSWDIEGEAQATDFEELTDDISTYGEETVEFRTVNTSDEGRIFHTYEKWECWAAGFYRDTMPGLTKEGAEHVFCKLLSDLPRFCEALHGVITTWKHSCEHYLTNTAMNRIAWLGQAAACYSHGLPAAVRGGWGLLTEQQQVAADNAALVALNQWLSQNGRPSVTMQEANPGRQATIY